MDLGKPLEILIEDYIAKTHDLDNDDYTLFLYGFDDNTASLLNDLFDSESYKVTTVNTNNLTRLIANGADHEFLDNMDPILLLMSDSGTEYRNRIINKLEDKYKARNFGVINLPHNASEGQLQEYINAAKSKIKLERMKRKLAKDISNEKRKKFPDHGNTQAEREDDWNKASERLEKKVSYKFFICDNHIDRAKEIAKGLEEKDYSNIYIVRLHTKDQEAPESQKDKLDLHYRNYQTLTQKIVEKASPDTIFLLRTPKKEDILDRVILQELTDQIREQYLDDEFQVMLIATDAEFGKYSSSQLDLSHHFIRVSDEHAITLDQNIKDYTQTAVERLIQDMIKTRDAKEYNKQKPDLLFNDMVHQILDKNDFSRAEEIAEEGLDSINSAKKQTEIEINRASTKQSSADMVIWLNELNNKRDKFLKWLSLIRGEESQVPVYRISTDQVYVLDNVPGSEELCVKVYDNSSRYYAEYHMLKFLEKFNQDIKFKLMNKPSNFDVENPYLQINTKIIKMEKQLSGLKPDKDGKYSMLTDWIQGPTMYEIGKSIMENRRKPKARELIRRVNLRINKYLAILQKNHAELAEEFKEVTDFSQHLHKSFSENLEYAQLKLPKESINCLNYCIELFGSFIKQKPDLMYFDVQLTNIVLKTGNNASTLDEILETVDEQGIKPLVTENMYKIDFNKAHRLTSRIEDKRHDYQELKMEEDERESLDLHYLLYSKKLELWDELENYDIKKLPKRLESTRDDLKNIDKFIKRLEDNKKVKKGHKLYTEITNWMKSNMQKEYNDFYQDEPFIALYRVLRWRDHFLTKYLKQSTLQLEKISSEILKNVKDHKLGELKNATQLFEYIEISKTPEKKYSIKDSKFFDYVDPKYKTTCLSLLKEHKKINKLSKGYANEVIYLYGRALSIVRGMINNFGNKIYEETDEYIVQMRTKLKELNTALKKSYNSETNKFDSNPSQNYLLFMQELKEKYDSNSEDKHKIEDLLTFASAKYTRFILEQTRQFDRGTLLKK